jgi:hypothetical protein
MKRLRGLGMLKPEKLRLNGLTPNSAARRPDDTARPGGFVYAGMAQGLGYPVDREVYEARTLERKNVTNAGQAPPEVRPIPVPGLQVTPIQGPSVQAFGAPGFAGEVDALVRESKHVEVPPVGLANFGPSAARPELLKPEAWQQYLDHGFAVNSQVAQLEEQQRLMQQLQQGMTNESIERAIPAPNGSGRGEGPRGVDGNQEA